MRAMGLGRRLVEGAFKKLDEVNERDQARAVAKLSPAEREHYDMWVARTEALNVGAAVEELGDPRLLTKVLQGPAGEELHGVVKAPKRPAPIEDAAAWEAQAAAERAARDELRAPYLAPARAPLQIARVLTQERTQVRDVCDYLASSGLAARADLVYGVYRVPDAIDLGKLLGARVVEWDVVHAAEGTLPPAAPPASAFFEARRRWVDRAPGEPRPLDEDLGLDILARASVGPERTLGIARELTISHRGDDNDESHSTILAAVRGVHVLADPGPSAALAAASGGGPWSVPHEPPAEVVVDVLHWDAIAQAIHPVRQRRAPLPSPFPYLPLTPQELLRAYLEIVGVQPSDAYSAQVTHDRPFDLMGRTSTKWGVRRTGGGPDLPCADGKLRKRMAGGHHVVVAYRDRPEYAPGRTRFDAYADDVLQARLRQMLGVRAPVPKPPGKLSKTIDRVGDVVEFFTMEPTADHDPAPPRYCWPPRQGSRR
jgi:hypothetical protein